MVERGIHPEAIELNHRIVAKRERKSELRSRKLAVNAVSERLRIPKNGKSDVLSLLLNPMDTLGEYQTPFLTIQNREDILELRRDAEDAISLVEGLPEELHQRAVLHLLALSNVKETFSKAKI